MSKMIPRRTVDALRNFLDVSIEGYGINCDLYIPLNLNEVDALDVYAKPSDFEFEHYTAKVFVEWSPNAYRLRTMGLYTEGDLPILARFGRKAISDVGVIRNVDILVGSYITVEPEYVPENYVGIDAFDVIDIGVGPFHDALVAKLYKLAPRRVA